jgi:hypothetical protein
VRIHYPYDAPAGLTLRVVGASEHRGERFVIAYQPDGTRTRVPQWMTCPESARLSVHSPPRLSIASLRVLRLEVDSASSLLPGKHVETRENPAEVVVIDDDQGISGSGVSRPDFDRLLVAICQRSRCFAR